VIPGDCTPTSFLLGTDYVPTSAITVIDPALPDWAPKPNPDDIRPENSNEYGLSFELIETPGQYPSVTIDLNKPFTSGTSLEVFEIVIANDNKLTVTVEYKQTDKDVDFKTFVNADGKSLENVPVDSTSFKITPQDIGVLRIKVISSADDTAEQYHFTLDVFGCSETFSKYYIEYQMFLLDNLF
jgi:hypothetical protein